MMKVKNSSNAYMSDERIIKSEMIPVRIIEGAGVKWFKLIIDLKYSKYKMYKFKMNYKNKYHDKNVFRKFNFSDNNIVLKFETVK